MFARCGEPCLPARSPVLGLICPWVVTVSPALGGRAGEWEGEGPAHQPALALDVADKLPSSLSVPLTPSATASVRP